MKKRVLGQSLEVSEIGVGCMEMSEFYGPRNGTESKAVLHKAIDLGCTFLDTADNYGHYYNEQLLGEFLKESRAEIKVATKCGIVRRLGEYQRVIDNSPDYIRRACDVVLTAEDLARIESAVQEFKPSGERYISEGMKGVNA